MFKGWFQKQEQYIGDFSFLKIDMHSHLVPGIDDGSKSIEESLLFIEEFKKLGFTGAITTPHIISDIYPNSIKTIQSEFTILAEKVKGFDLQYAAEYMVNAEFEDLVATDELLTLGDKYVLVEMSYIAESANFRDMIFKLKVKGYKPILAHPERYNFFHRNYKKYQDIKDLGCQFQLNILSVTGYYGVEARNVALKLLADQMIDFAGTDLHHERHMEALKALTTSKQLKELQQYNFKNELLANKK